MKKQRRISKKEERILAEIERELAEIEDANLSVYELRGTRETDRNRTWK